MIDLIVLDRNEVFSMPIRAKEVVHYRELAGQDTLKFKTRLEKIEKGYRVLVPLAKIGYESWRGNEFIVDNVIEGRDGLVVECVASISEMYQDFVEKITYKGPADEFLRSLINTKTRWILRNGMPFTLNQEWKFEKMSVREIIGEIQKASGLELDYIVEWNGYRVTSRVLWLTEQIGKNNGKEFEYGRDATRIERHKLSRPIITKLYAYGKEIHPKAVKGIKQEPYDTTFASLNDGKTYITNEDARERYGRIGKDGQKMHYEGFVEFREVEDPAELLKLATEYLAEVSHPSVGYEASVFDLKQAGFEADGVALGDTVRVIDRELQINAFARVTAYEQYLDNSSMNRIVLGFGMDAAVEAVNKQATDLETIFNRVRTAEEDIRESQIGIVENMLTHFNDQMNGSLFEGEVKAFPGGFEFINPDGTATQISSVGWRTANRKNAQDEWEWTTIATGDGLAAETVGAKQIIAGSIYSDHIDAAGIRSDLIRVGDVSLDTKLIEISQDGIELHDFAEGLEAKLSAQALTLTDIDGRVTQVEAGKIALLEEVNDSVTVLQNQKIAMQREIDGMDSQITTLQNGKLSISEWNMQKRYIDSDIDGAKQEASDAKSIANAQEARITNVEAGAITLSTKTGGQIANMKVTTDRLIFDGYSAKFAISASPLNNYFIYAGQEWQSPNFIVNREGKLFAKDADIQGSFRGSTATMGAWTLESDRLEAKNTLRETILRTTSGSDFLRFYTKATDPYRRFYVDHICVAYGYGFKELSDRRLKTNITVPSKEAESLALGVDIVEFEWKNSEQPKMLGAIAQQVQGIYPAAVTECSDGYLSLDYKQIALSTTLEVQKLHRRVSELEEEVARWRSK